MCRLLHAGLVVVLATYFTMIKTKHFFHELRKPFRGAIHSAAQKGVACAPSLNLYFTLENDTKAAFSPGTDLLTTSLFLTDANSIIR